MMLYGAPDTMAALQFPIDAKVTITERVTK